MNGLWAGMMLVAVVYGAFYGTLPDITQAALDSAKEAVTLSMTMLGILAFWMGLMQIGTASGLVERLTKGVEPLLRRLFPRIPAGHPAMGQIALNCIANMLGLGWAATPAGLKAMEELGRIQRNKACKDPTAASNEMCNFLILNISSLQLIPVNIIVYRSQYGSVTPTSIIMPAILATTCSTLAGILFIKFADKSFS